MNLLVYLKKILQDNLELLNILEILLNNKINKNWVSKLIILNRMINKLIILNRIINIINYLKSNHHNQEEESLFQKEHLKKRLSIDYFHLNLITIKLHDILESYKFKILIAILQLNLIYINIIILKLQMIIELEDKLTASIHITNQQDQNYGVR